MPIGSCNNVDKALPNTVIPTLKELKDLAADTSTINQMAKDVSVVVEAFEQASVLITELSA